MDGGTSVSNNAKPPCWKCKRVSELTHRYLIIPGNAVRQDNQIHLEMCIPVPARSVQPKHRLFPARSFRVIIHANRPVNPLRCCAVKNYNNREGLDTAEKSSPGTTSGATPSPALKSNKRATLCGIFKFPGFCSKGFFSYENSPCPSRHFILAENC